MGIIRAALNAVGGTLQDQYKEFIYCEALPMNVLIRKGQNKIMTGNTNHSNDNIITDGSRIAVADGQCMLIVENGKIMDFCAEAGEFIYETGTSPSMLTGGMDGLKKSFCILWARVQAGGQQDQDQRVYYVNTKEIIGNKVGAGDIPFRDSEFDFTMKLRCFGEYSYKITDPIMFYTNMCGNVGYEFTREQIDSQLKAEIQTSIQPAIGRIALKKIPYDQLVLFTKEIAQELNNEMTVEWVTKRGISLISLALASVTPDAESAMKIEQFQSSRVYTDTRMLGARLGEAQANAMENASKNDNGAMIGFMGSNMAQQSGATTINQLFQMDNNNKEGNTILKVQSDNDISYDKSRQITDSTWVNEWVCSCGMRNTGKFCSDCGAKRPVILDTHCETCGFDGDKPFKFCPECGSENKV